MYQKLFKWQVGFFEEENMYSVIPSNWVYRDNNGIFLCKWPVKQRVTEIILMKAINPESNWLSYPVTIIATFGMYNLLVPNYDSKNLFAY